MEGIVKLQPVQHQGGKKGGKSQNAEIIALKQQVQALQQALEKKEHQGKKEHQKPQKKPTIRHQDVKGLVDNKKGDLPIYMRLDNAFNKGGVHQVNQEIGKLEKELKDTLHGIDLFSLTTEMSVNGRNFYLSQKKYVWYVLESFIRKVGKDSFPTLFTENYSYSYYTYKFEGLSNCEEHFWRYFNVVMLVLFLGPVETGNFLSNNDKYYRLILRTCRHEKESVRKDVISSYFKDNMDILTKMIKYCLSAYRTFYQDTKRSSLSRGEKPFSPAFVIVNGVQGKLQNKISLMDDINSVTDSILNSFKR